VTKPSKAFDAVFFAGEPTPGLAIVEGSSGSPRKWQEIGGYGLTGATLRFTGLGLAKFDVIVTLITDAHWLAWEPYQQRVLAPPKLGTYARALSIFHPLLKPLEIRECVVNDISIPKQAQAGVWQVLIPCQAFRKPKLTFATPEGAKATPTDPVDAQIEANRALIAAQREALARGR
jgi:hypothetical protein